MAFKIHIKGWEDGERVEQTLETFDRWLIHSAEEVAVELAGTRVALHQKPHAITAKRMGVGACLWEGELLLAAYLAALPSHTFVGARVVELGAGPGLAGLLLAKLGAQVVLTDKDVVLPLLEENVALNALPDRPRPTPPSSSSSSSAAAAATAGGVSSGSAEVAELEWGKEGYEAAAATLSARRLDLVLAADCCYIDQDGASPSTPHFVRAARALCGGGGASSRTRVLVSFELRSSAVKATFLGEAARAFSRVSRVARGAMPRGYAAEHIELYELRP